MAQAFYLFSIAKLIEWTIIKNFNTHAQKLLRQLRDATYDAHSLGEGSLTRSCAHRAVEMSSSHNRHTHRETRATVARTSD